MHHHAKAGQLLATVTEMNTLERIAKEAVGFVQVLIPQNFVAFRVALFGYLVGRPMICCEAKIRCD